jgi:hypothetical protein
VSRNYDYDFPLTKEEERALEEKYEKYQAEKRRREQQTENPDTDGSILPNGDF